MNEIVTINLAFYNLLVRSRQPIPYVNILYIAQITIYYKVLCKPHYRFTIYYVDNKNNIYYNSERALGCIYKLTLKGLHMFLSNLSEDQKMIHKLISDFSENEIKPVASENERNSRFPAELIKKLGELGFMGHFVPTEYGGCG